MPPKLARVLPWDHIEPVSFTPAADLHGDIARLTKRHEQRAADSAEFRYLRADIAAVDAIRAQKSLSLSFKVRDAERKSQDGARLERENALRTLRGKPPIKSLEELKEDSAAGIILDETAQIAADYAVLDVARHNGPTQARRAEPQS